MDPQILWHSSAGPNLLSSQTAEMISAPLKALVVVGGQQFLMEPHLGASVSVLLTLNSLVASWVMELLLLIELNV